MHRSLSLVAALCLAAPAARAHAIFPGQQTVRTVGDRAYARFNAVNGRRDVSEFVVEIFDGDSWTPSTRAVASPGRLTVPAPDPNSLESVDRPFSILVDLDGRDERTFRVCTKSVFRQTVLRPTVSRLNTRVCANIIVRRF